MNLLKSMELFSLVVELGNFSKVSRRVGKSPSSISRQIDMLEDSLGVRLFQRTTQQLSLTEAGHLYYEKVTKILNDLDEVNSEMSTLQSSPKGVLRVSAPISFGERYISPHIPEFLEGFPGMNVDLTLTNQHPDMFQEKLDVVVRIGTLPDSSLIARPLADNKSIICVSPQYLSKHGTPSSPEELSDHNCLTYNIGPRDIWHFNKGDEHHELAITGNFKSNVGESLQTVTRNGLGISMLSYWLAKADLEAGNLVQLFADYDTSLISGQKGGIYALYTSRRHLAPKIRVFIDYLQQKLSYLRKS